ncbi:MAG TPA: hypothetical protein VIG99_21935 [Myxococcaceae bacterium]|jgi:hypothetical protein
MEADRPNLGLGPELGIVLRAAAERGVRGVLPMAATLPTADVDVAGGDASAGERTPQDVLEADVLSHHGAVRRGEQQIIGGVGQRALQVRTKYSASRKTKLRGLRRVLLRHLQDPPLHLGGELLE